MKFLRLRLLLVLAFIAAQSFALAHATRHDLLQQENAACAICLIAHAAPLPPAPATLPALSVPSDRAAVVATAVTLDRRPFARPHSRGPPLFLA